MTWKLLPLYPSFLDCRKGASTGRVDERASLVGLVLSLYYTTLLFFFPITFVGSEGVLTGGENSSSQIFHFPFYIFQSFSTVKNTGDIERICFSVLSVARILERGKNSGAAGFVSALLLLKDVPSDCLCMCFLFTVNIYMHYV